MGRILGLDVGTVRIGVAVSDPLGSFAQGIAVLDAKGEWIRELDVLVAQYNPDLIVVGLPVREDGTQGPAAEKILEKTEMLRESYPNVEIRFWDERYTSTIANRILIEGDISRRKRKKSVDKIAASLILQGYLDSIR